MSGWGAVVALALAAQPLSPAPTPAPDPPAPPDPVQRVAASVVHLAILSVAGEELGNGTGFLVDSSGTVVTNQHVIEDASRLEAVLAGGEKRQVVGVLARGDVHNDDLAVIRLEPGQYSPLPLGPDGDVKQGTPVVVVGSPHGLANTASKGIVSALRPDGTPKHPGEEQFYSGPLIQLSVPISGGSSGSPVVDPEGQVVGVVQSGYVGSGELDFAVPVASVRKMLAGISPNQKPAPLRPFPLRNVIISIVVFLALGVWWLRTHGPAPGGRPRRAAKAI